MPQWQFDCDQGWEVTLKVGSTFSAEVRWVLEWIPSCFFLQLSCCADNNNNMSAVQTAWYFVVIKTSCNLKNLDLVSIYSVFNGSQYRITVTQSMLERCWITLKMLRATRKGTSEALYRVSYLLIAQVPSFVFKVNKNGGTKAKLRLNQ